MQYIESYSGTVPGFATGTAYKRPYAWNYPSVTTIPSYTYANKSQIDFFNQTIADFLSKCGVSASYGVKSDLDNSYSWLWINSIPLLYMIGGASATATSNKYTGLWAPDYITTTSGGQSSAPQNIDTSNGSATSTPYNNYTSTYNFKLGFAGNPQGSWIFRWTTYQSTSFSLNGFQYIPMADKRTGLPGALILKLGGTSKTGFWTSFQGTEFSNNSSIGNLSSTPTEGLIKMISQTGIDSSEYPLIPISYGLLEGTNAAYMYVYNEQFPKTKIPLATADELMEIQIGDDKFLHTTYPGSTTNAINAGLIRL